MRAVFQLSVLKPRVTTLNNQNYTGNPVNQSKLHRQSSASIETPRKKRQDMKRVMR